MRYSGIQPQYFPRLHYFARILAADTFVLRDEVQYVRSHKYPDGRRDSSYQAATPIKQAFGTQLLTVPARHEGPQPIVNTNIAYDHKWAMQHLNAIRFAYGRTPNFDQLFPELKDLLRQKYENLAELNIATLVWVLWHLLGVKRVGPDDLSLAAMKDQLRENTRFRLKEIRRGSESQAFKTKKSMTPNEKILALIKEVGATEDYCGGTAHTAYMDEDLFKKHGITVTVQDWKCQEYAQAFTKQQGFLPNLSILDLLMNVPIRDAAKIILS